MQTLGGLERYGKTTRRAQFLAEMDPSLGPVEATIISAPSSTKNKDCKRDPEMHRHLRSPRAKDFINRRCGGRS